MLEGEGPTSADTGVASCLLFDTETVFRRLRDDYWDGIVFVVGMRRLGGIELPKREYVGMLSGKWSSRGVRESKASRSTTERYWTQNGQFSTAKLS